MKQATILLSFTFLLPSVHLSVKNVHLLLPMSAERGQMMNWRLGETFNLLLNLILLMYFWKNSVFHLFPTFQAVFSIHAFEIWMSLDSVFLYIFKGIEKSINSLHIYPNSPPPLFCSLHIFFGGQNQYS